MVANIFTRRHPTLEVGSIDPISTFSEHGPVAYQIKGNHKCSNMVANILPADPPPPPTQPPLPRVPNPRGWGQKVEIQLFQNMVMLHIKLKGMTHTATW